MDRMVNDTTSCRFLGSVNIILLLFQWFEVKTLRFYGYFQDDTSCPVRQPSEAPFPESGQNASQSWTTLIYDSDISGHNILVLL